MTTNDAVVSGAVLSYTKLVVSDVDVSVAWYTDVLGMRELQRVTFVNPDAVEVVMADVTGPKLVLMQSPSMPVQSGLPTWTPMAFVVDDAKEAAARIKAGGHQLAVDPPLELGPTVIAIAADPDGYMIELISTVLAEDSQIDVGAAPDGAMEHPLPEIHHLTLR